MSSYTWVLLAILLMSLAFYGYRRQHREFGKALKRLADQRLTAAHKARFSSGGLTSFPRLVVYHHEGPIMVSAMASAGAAAGAGPLTFGRQTLTRISPLQFKLVRKTRSVQSLVDRPAGGSASEPGSVSLRRDFFIETDSPDCFEKVFAAELESEVAKAVSVSRVTCGEEVLTASVEGLCTDEATLLSISQLVGAVADQLAEIHHQTIEINGTDKLSQKQE
ncbi:MAG: hypothetical protein AAF098_07755 [Pseudomonadota bacterium]